MSGYKGNISLIIVLGSLLSIQAFSQQRDSLAVDNSQKVILKPRMNYSLGSTFMFVPHLGSVAGFTITPFLSIPVSPKLSVAGGIIAGYYYSVPWSNREGAITSEFNEISIFGSASYHVNSQLTLYGAGIKQITGNSPFYLLPKSNYTIGSTYNFGSFSVGVSVEMSKWNNNPGPLPFSPGVYSPFEQRQGTFMPFGR